MTSLLAVVILLLAVSTYAQPCIDSGNINRTLATPLTFPTQSLAASLCVANANDFYLISVPRGAYGSIVVRLAHQVSDGDIDLQLQDAAGTVLESAAGTSGIELFTETGITEGSYYIRAFVFSISNANGANYSLFYNFTTTCQEDIYFPNNNRSIAAFLSLPAAITGRICNVNFDDFFKIAAGNGTLVILLNHTDPSNADVELRLQSADGTLLASSTDTDGTEEIIISVTQAIYYVVADALSVGTGVAYDLVITSNGTLVTTGTPDTTAAQTTAAGTTALATTGGVVTTAVVNTTAAAPTTSRPTTNAQTTGAITGVVATTGIPVASASGLELSLMSLMALIIGFFAL
jgi:hypothetical protein